MMKAFVYQCVYTLRVFEYLRVYARKHIAMMPDVRVVKLLIQSAFTRLTESKRRFTASIPFGGDVSLLLPLHSSVHADGAFDSAL